MININLSNGINAVANERIPITVSSEKEIYLVREN
jgi:hypothetical protein